MNVLRFVEWVGVKFKGKNPFIEIRTPMYDETGARRR